MGIGRVWKAVLLLAVGAAGGGAALAVAGVPDPTGVIHACVTTTAGEPVTAATVGNVKIIDPNAGQSCNPAGAPPNEESIAWNTAGPTGPPGAPGAPGPPGPPGRSVTIAGGNTLTLAGGQVITVGNPTGVTIKPPAFGSKAVATLTLSGGVDLTSSVLSFGLSPNHASPSTGSGARKVKSGEFQITRTTDKASPKLALACANGTHIKKVVLTLRKTGKPIVTYTLTDALISTFQGGSNPHGGQPAENLSFNYTKIDIKYTPH